MGTSGDAGGGESGYGEDTKAKSGEHMVTLIRWFKKIGERIRIPQCDDGSHYTGGGSDWPSWTRAS
jgi:hypothetical protein